MKRIVKYGLLATAIFLSAVGISSAQNCQPKRIVIHQTSKTLTLKGTTRGCNDFLLRLRKNQRLSINLTSTKGNAYFHFDTKAGLESGGDFFLRSLHELRRKNQPKRQLDNQRFSRHFSAR